MKTPISPTTSTTSALATEDSLRATAAALEAKKLHPHIVDTGTAALEKIKQLIPKEASVMNGASVTLQQIGFVDYLKSGNHGWNNLHEQIVAEKDEQKQAELRKQSVLSDYYLGSVHALTEEGDFVIASNTGSQLTHIVYTSANLIFVVSTKKIVKNLEEAMARLNTVVVPLEDKRSQAAYGVGTSLNKIVIFKNENPMTGRKVNLILVKEDLGY